MAEFTNFEVTPRLDRAQVEQLVVHLLRTQELFELAVTKISPEHFLTAGEAHLRSLWFVFLDLVNRYGRETMFGNPLQAYHLMGTELSAFCANHPEDIQPEYQDLLFHRDTQNPGLLQYAYETITSDQLTPAWARTCLLDFLREREVQDPWRRLLEKVGRDTLLNVPQICRDIHERSLEVDCLDNDAGDILCPVGWEPTPLPKFPTGITFIDEFLSGGHAPGETYGVLGAFGSGKTTLACQLVVKGALYQRLRHSKDKSYKPKRWYFMHYEGSTDEMRVRLLSCLCDIDRLKIENWQPDQLSRSPKLHAYEMDRFAVRIHKNGLSSVPGEWERWEKRRMLINKTFTMMDMSGTPKDPRRGQGYIPEIQALIERNLRKVRSQGMHDEVGGVVIDYAGLCCKRYIAGHNKPHDEFYHLLGNFGEECRRQLAAHFQCPVWIMHQLSGEANKRTHSARQSHADAQGNHSFAENMVFCFELGTKDPKYGSMLFGCSKARRAPLSLPPRVELDVPIAALRKSDLIEVGNELVRKGDGSEVHIGS